VFHPYCSNAAESTEGIACIIKLVEKMRDLQRIVLPTQVVEAPDGCVDFACNADVMCLFV